MNILVTTVVIATFVVCAFGGKDDKLDKKKRGLLGEGVLPLRSPDVGVIGTEVAANSFAGDLTIATNGIPVATNIQSNAPLATNAFAAGFSVNGQGFADGGLSGNLLATGASAPFPIGEERHTHITRKFAVAVPQPYTVPVQNDNYIPYPQPVPVTINNPVAVQVPQAVPVAIDRPIPVAVDQPVPVPFPLRIPVPVQQNVAYPVAQPIPVPVRQAIPVPIPQQIPQSGLFGISGFGATIQGGQFLGGSRGSFLTAPAFGGSAFNSGGVVLQSGQAFGGPGINSGGVVLQSGQAFGGPGINSAGVVLQSGPLSSPGVAVQQNIVAPSGSAFLSLPSGVAASGPSGFGTTRIVNTPLSASHISGGVSVNFNKKW